MPLRDHFHLPDMKLASWEEVHGMWPSLMAMRLNTILPPEYRSGVKIHLGTLVELDAGVSELDEAREVDDSVTNAALAWEAANPTLLLETDELTPPEYEVRIYDERQGRQLVAAVEIVSPRNKDRQSARNQFVAKCHTLLQQQVCVVIVDPVTTPSGNLFAELAERLEAEPPSSANSSIYAVSMRLVSVNGRVRVEIWEHVLEVGATLPTLPLWITDTKYVALELERTYQETCKGLRIN